MAIRDLILSHGDPERSLDELRMQWQEMAGSTNQLLPLDGGWRDMLGEVTVKGTGSANPSWAAYNGTSVYQYQFSNVSTTEVWVNYHIQHDYKPGSDLFLHIHWSQTTVDSGGAGSAPGQAKWSFDVLYAKGHQQAAFASSVVTTSVLQTASSTARTHMIAEVQLSAASPSASQIDSGEIEVDGVLMVRAYRNPVDASDTLNVAPFVHYIDLHYQTNRLNTLNKAPNFYK